MFAQYHLNVHNTPTEDGEAHFDIGGRWNLSVHASASEDHEDTLVLVTSAQFEPNEKVREVFEDLANDTLPKGSKTYEFVGGKVEPGESLDKRIPPHHILPNAFSSYTAELRADMASEARSIANIYRWRSDVYIPRRRGFSVRPAEFSLDGESWRMLPFEGSTRGWTGAHVRFDDKRFERTVQPLLDSGETEPLGFELLSEAYEVSETNTRAALVIAVMALEVGFKGFVSDLTPDAEWLAMNAPSPPIEKMLREYLPTIPVTNRLPSDEVQPPPNETMTVIRDAVVRRNAITHRGSKASLERLDQTLHAVGDVLRLLDFYKGHKWAVEYMSDPFAVALGLRDTDPVLDEAFEFER